MTLRHNTPAVSLGFLDVPLKWVIEMDRINRIYKKEGVERFSQREAFL
jgi:hypothetical protein